MIRNILTAALLILNLPLFAQAQAELNDSSPPATSEPQEGRSLFHLTQEDSITWALTASLSPLLAEQWGVQSQVPSDKGTSAPPYPSQKLNPGRALLLSAILPGAGQYYAGMRWRALLFLSIELAAWTGVIYFYNQGMDKENEFKRFADTHFHEDWYRQKEYELAINPSYGDSGAYRGSIDEWIRLSWDLRIHYLPSVGFTHDLPLPEVRQRNKSEDQQYYEMIGKYIRQFGFGWDDAFGDDPNTPYFDGRSPRSEHYMDIRYQSNQALERSAVSVQVAMLNHIVSALHASFSVRALNRQVRAQVGFRPVDYDRRVLAVGGLHLKW